jgi:uncharacterized protein involved in exopolysaccharide biosynthesis/protein involved in polysaccharide export with SLBB domain
LPDGSVPQSALPDERAYQGSSADHSPGAFVSLRDLVRVLSRRRRVVLGVVGGLLLACLLYCLIAPNQYEAKARVALRTAPAAPLGIDVAEPAAGTSILSAPLQQETVANVFRSDRLAWRVITGLKLYQAAAFNGKFSGLFPGFRPETPSPEAQAYLLERFRRRLHVLTLPRTLMIEIRFRSKDAALSASVVNALIDAFGQQEGEARVAATAEATGWLESQLKALKASVEQDARQLAAFQTEHGILDATETLGNGQTGEGEHSSILLEIDELGRELVAATTDRILREAEYRAASKGNPELVFASNPHMQAEAGTFATALLEQLRSRGSELEQEQAQLSLEHGPNFPRVAEIRRQLQDLDVQTAAEDAKLVERFRDAWQTANDREEMVRRSLEEHTAEGLKLNRAATEYAVIRQEANSSHEVYLRVAEKVQEAGLVAGIRSSAISVVDRALQPVKPVAPDLPLYMAITLFVSLWLAVGGALMVESLHSGAGPGAGRVVVVLVAALLAGGMVRGQAPTPNTSGLPGSALHPPLTPEAKRPPTAQDAPAVWDGAAAQPTLPAQAGGLVLAPMAAPIGPGDTLDVSEYHTPEFHSMVRVSSTGTVTLPMIKEVQLGGMDEEAAAHAIEAALVAQGVLTHPQVSVLVTAYAGQDVSVLGEVARPGVYAYTLHHRLLDLISAASGVSPAAGRLVNVYHRNDPKTAVPVVLDPGGLDTGADHNPELLPGDTVQVSRAGLVYVIGDVVRPGGFPVDPAQGLTVVQALSLAWGPVQNAATGRALLIREQKGGRTLTTLNLKHMLHGQEPDQPIRDRDILFVPDSTAKNLWNKGVEAAIQSAIGVSIYSGLVYSQRF